MAGCFGGCLLGSTVVEVPRCRDAEVLGASGRCWDAEVSGL